MSATVTPTPEGYVKVAWFSYPGMHTVWNPSKVHLADPEDPRLEAICGARKGRYAKRSSERDMDEHECDAGLCKRCWGMLR